MAPMLMIVCCSKKGRGIELTSTSAVVPRRLSDALDQFLREYKILYLTAGAGWGKTTAVRGYLQSTPHVWLQVQSGRTPRFSAKMPLVVLDDFHNLSEHLEKRVAEIFRRSPRRQKLCLLSRGPLPDFLLSYRYDGSLRLLTAEELALGVDEISQLAAQRGMTLSMDDIFRLEQVSHGYPPLIEYLLDAFPAEGLTRRALDSARKRLDLYFDAALYRSWDSETQAVLLRLSYFREITTSLAGRVLDDAAAEDTLLRISRMTGVLEPEVGGHWRFRDAERLLPYLRGRADRELSAPQIRTLHQKGGAWCAGHGDFPGAVEHYHAAGSRADVVDTLIQAVRHNAESWTLLRMADCFHSLTDAELRGAPELAFAMSRIAGLQLDFDLAERWYRVLEEQAAGPDPALAQSYLFYLDLCLPHCGVSAVRRRFGELRPLLEAGALPTSYTSLTCGLPSILRGERDFSELLYETPDFFSTPIRAVARSVLGRHSVGLSELLHAEYQLETGADVAAMLLQWHPLQLRIREAGTLASEFVCVALMVRALCAEGQLPEAAAYLLRFRQRAESAGADSLLGNLDALRCRLALMEDSLYASHWFAAQPPAGDAFALPDSYQLLTRVRCHIKREEYHAALLILGRLLDAFQRGFRPLDTIEALLLAAICRHRMGGDGWREHLSEALDMGGKYGYISVFAREGAALTPLLEEYAPRDVDPEYWKRVMRRTLGYASRYPWYLRPLRHLSAPLTPTERTVLLLLLRNKTNEEIAQILGNKPRTVQTHIRNLFEKLDVHSREEARRVAVRLKLDQ